jgi:hypothetical protein
MHKGNFRAKLGGLTGAKYARRKNIAFTNAKKKEPKIREEHGQQCHVRVHGISALKFDHTHHNH